MVRLDKPRRKDCGRQLSVGLATVWVKIHTFRGRVTLQADVSLDMAAGRAKMTHMRDVRPAARSPSLVPLLGLRRGREKEIAPYDTPGVSHHGHRNQGA
jgi:hypothetical protein